MLKIESQTGTAQVPKNIATVSCRMPPVICRAAYKTVEPTRQTPAKAATKVDCWGEFGVNLKNSNALRSGLRMHSENAYENDSHIYLSVQFELPSMLNSGTTMFSTSLVYEEFIHLLMSKFTLN